MSHIWNYFKNHKTRHISGGDDVLDGDKVDITYVPANYTRTTVPPEADVVTDLTAHLAGVDNSIGTLSQKATAFMYVSASAATAVTGALTPIKIAGTTTLDGTSVRSFTMPANNRLTYTGSVTVACVMSVSLSFVSNTNDVVYGFYIAVNGTIVGASRIRRRITSGSHANVISLNLIRTLSTNDTVEIWAENEQGASNLTVEQMTVSVHEV